MWSKIERIISMSTIAAKTANASLSLLTDLYQLTMACAYWKSGTADKMAAFHFSFRKPPFDSGFTIACGLSAAACSSPPCSCSVRSSLGRTPSIHSSR